MKKNDIKGRLRKLLLKTAIATSALSATSCGYDLSQAESRWLEANPEATTITIGRGGKHAFPNKGTLYFQKEDGKFILKEVDKKTIPDRSYLAAKKERDTLRIKNINEKYSQQINNYMNMLDNVISKQQEANALFLSSIEQGDFDKMCKALEMGADVNVQDSKNGNTGIMIAKEQLPFAKAFKIARYLVTEPNFNPSIENRDGISFIDMLDAELSKGNAAWQSISRKADMLNPDMSRNRKNTPIKQQIKQLQNEYNRFIQSYGEEMRQVLGYEAKIESSGDSFYSGQLRSCDEEGTSYVDYLSWDARYNTDHGFVFSDRPLTVLDALHLERKDGSWEEIPLFLTNLEDKYDPKRLDIKMLAQDFTDIENQQNSNNTTNIVAQGGFNHASTDAETYMFVRGRRGSYSLVKIQTHIQADKVK